MKSICASLYFRRSRFAKKSTPGFGFAISTGEVESHPESSGIGQAAAVAYAPVSCQLGRISW
jgi:hypothetical protein